MPSNHPPPAKTTPPRLAEVVARERLFSALDERCRSPVVWLSGPAGAGKTTLMASYLETRGTTSRWYQLDAGDGDVGSFFYYMALASRASGAGDDEPGLPLFTGEYQGDLGRFTRRYFRRLYEGLASPFMLVLDNYQDVPPQSPFHGVLVDAVAELPPDASIAVLSRGMPPPALARLRANRSLELVSWNELRLTRQESDDIVARWHDELDEAVLARLYEKTQGWAAALVLVLDQATADGLIEELPDMARPEAAVFDYLAGEIFETFDEATRELLLKTACLPEMTPALAAQLSGEPRAGELLAALHRSFHLVSLKPGSGGNVYQHHPMLQQFLAAQARERLPRDERRSIRRRGASLLEGAGRVDAALAMLREEGDWRGIAGVLVRRAPEMLAQGRGETLGKILDELPDKVLEGEPWLRYWLATCRFHAAPREARLHYERAAAGFATGDTWDEAGTLLSCAGAMDAVIYELDDLSLLDPWIARVSELVARHGDVREPHVSARLAASMFMALVFRQPWHADLTHWAKLTYQQLDAIEDANARLTAQLLIAINLNYTGQFSKARDFVESMRRLCESPHVPPVALTVLKDVESMYYMLTADHERCVRAVYDGMEIARSSGVHLWSYHILSNGVAGALATGDLDTAGEFLDRMREYQGTARRLDLCIYHYCAGWLAALQDDPVASFQALKTALRLAVECGCPFYEVLCRLGLAQASDACGDARRAGTELRRLRRLAEHVDNRLLEFMCLLGYAHIALGNGRRRSGLNSLRYAMGVGREYGFRHFLGWHPRVMSELCERALREGFEPEYVRGLIRERGLDPGPSAASMAEWPWRYRIFSFGGFRVLEDDRALEQRTKPQQRPMELLRMLVGAGGEDVPESALAESLWPRVDGDYAHRSLTTTLHRLRKLLGDDRVVRLRHGRLSLCPVRCWLDVWAFDRLVEELDEVLPRDPSRGYSARIETLRIRLFGLYRAPFMQGNVPDVHYVAPRERLRNRFLRCVGALARYFDATGASDRAAECYERALEVESLAESVYRRLMLCYRNMNRHAEAVEVYDRCRKTLKAELAIVPSPETTAIYERLVREL